MNRRLHPITEDYFKEHIHPYLLEFKDGRGRPALISDYDFEKAEELLEERIAILEKGKAPITEEEEILTLIKKNKAKLQATEQVVIIDSIVLPKSKILDVLKLDKECGTLLKYNHFFKKTQEEDHLVYLNQLENKVIYVEPNSKGKLRLKESVLIGKEWTAGVALKGLEEEENDNQNYPYMLSDGMTLYYASENGNSLGGYDIFMTRFDTDKQSYLSPENIGMPFNSPANDYLLIIDELNQLGWFLSDRNQHEDSVCLYTFIPSETRRIYNEDLIGKEQLRSFAKINCIRDTWNNTKEVESAQKKLHNLRTEKIKEKGEREFTFILNDNTTYYNLSQFKHPQSKTKMQLWLESTKEQEAKAVELEKLRLQYSRSPQHTKETLSPQIRFIESKIEESELDLKEQIKEIRRIELNQ